MNKDMAVDDRFTIPKNRSFKVCRVVFHLFFIVSDPLKVLMAVKDVRLQSSVFAGEFLTKTYLNMYITLRFG